jgi:UDP-N-acetyl-D-glucosamine dehydrogenase
MSLLDELLRRIDAREAVVGIVGLGYVGLPVALSFAEAGFHVVGIDLDKNKVDAIEKGKSFLQEVKDDQIAPLRKSGKLRAGTSYRRLKDADAILVSLPTPITEGQPDLSMVLAGGRAVAKMLKPGALVILESTTYPGTTEEVFKPLLEASGLVAGRDFFLAYSPERIDPGNPAYGFTDIPKIVGGIDDASTRAAAALYGQVVPKVQTVTGTREAELAKLIENTFRHVNIALVNELAVYAHDLDIDIWEAIEAAATKPFGFIPFWPSPGWGGHCIPLDPSYLSWRVRKDRAHEVRFVELAQAVNSEMSRYVVERISVMLNEHGKAVRDAKILGIGMAYKGGTEDTRGSPGVNVLGRLAKRGAIVSYHDPLVPEVSVLGEPIPSTSLTAEALRDQDVVIVFVPQIGINWELVARDAPLVLDCCNALGKRGGNVMRL